jgi:hypothetical protein
MNFLVFFLLFVRLGMTQNSTNDIIVYSAEGNFTFADFGYVFVLCRNDWNTGHGTTCTDLNFLNATVYLEVHNELHDIFFINEDWHNLRIEFFNGTIFDTNILKIYSYGNTTIIFSYDAYYMVPIPAPHVIPTPTNNIPSNKKQNRPDASPLVIIFFCVMLVFLLVGLSIIWNCYGVRDKIVACWNHCIYGIRNCGIQIV